MSGMAESLASVEPVTLPPAVYDAIVQHAREGKPEEICGVVRGRGLVAAEAVRGRNIAAERIEAEFGPEVASLVRTLTRRGGEAYEDYIARIAADPWATLIKRADLTDNLATLPAGHDLAKRYIAALVTLHP